ncbi:hypothetical protein [Caudovirales GX15bay]|nr:hypothetical protein [Caudovirales GX15bay]
MPDYTDNWGFSVLGPGDAFGSDGYKFSNGDIHLLDRLLAFAAEQHRHTGTSGTDTSPVSAPGLNLDLTGGALPAATRLFYRITVVDEYGNESAPSPSASIDTPGPIAEPGAPSPSFITGSGSLAPGSYSYVLSAYRDVDTLETKAVNAAMITVPGSSASNEVILTLPGPPVGADGFNVYRKSPSGMHYLWLDSIASPTVGDTWIDDGTIDGDCDRAIPPTNRTGNTSAVEVTYPGATPYLPDGWAWRIYRSTNDSDWSRSYLTDVNPIGATPVAVLEYLDLGGGTQLGGPPGTAQVINNPPKIELTDGAEVEGTLPPGLVVAPQMITFTAPGPVTAGSGTFVWTCDYDQADIISCRAHLGVDSVPAAQDVIVDVNALRPDVEGAWISIYDDGAGRPTVPVGETSGEPATPVHRHLVAGDALCVDIDQAGGGATPTDENLTVNILLYTQYGPTDNSYGW